MKDKKKGVCPVFSVVTVIMVSRNADGSTKDERMYAGSHEPPNEFGSIPARVHEVFHRLIVAIYLSTRKGTKIKRFDGRKYEK